MCGLNLERLSELPQNLAKLLDLKFEVTKKKTKGDYQNIYFNRRIRTQPVMKTVKGLVGDVDVSF